MRPTIFTGPNALTLVAASSNLGIFNRNTCNRDNCLRAVVANAARPGPIVGRADCSSFMVSTVTPCPTTSTVTVWQNTTVLASTGSTTDTSTTTIDPRVVSSPTGSSVSPVGSYSSDYDDSVSSWTSILGPPSTTSSGASLSATSVTPSSPMYMTSTASSMQVNLPPAHYGYKRETEPKPQHVEAAELRKRQFLNRCPGLTVPTAVPTYASACSGTVRYSSACSCNGVTAAVTTLDTSTVVITTTIVSTITLWPQSTTTMTVTRASTQTTSTASGSSYPDYVIDDMPNIYSDPFVVSDGSSSTSSSSLSSISSSSLGTSGSSMSSYYYSLDVNTTTYFPPSMPSSSVSSNYNSSTTTTSPTTGWSYNTTSISSTIISSSITSSNTSSASPLPTPYTFIGPFICSPSTGGYIECDYNDNNHYHLYSDPQRSLLMYIDPSGAIKAQGGDNFFLNVALTGNDPIDLTYNGNYWNHVPEDNKLFCSLDGGNEGTLSCVSGDREQDTFVQCGGSNIKFARGVPIGCAAIDVTCEAWK